MNYSKNHINNTKNLNTFQYKVSEENLSDILYRVTNYPWHEMPDDGGWDYGTLSLIHI